MDNKLTNLFETIDSLDADDKIKMCYKELLIFEFKCFDQINVRYKEVYKKLIDSYMED